MASIVGVARDRDALGARLVRVGDPDWIYGTVTLEAVDASVRDDPEAMARHAYARLRRLMRSARRLLVPVVLREIVAIHVELGRSALLSGRPDAVRFHADAAWKADNHSLDAIGFRADTHPDRSAVERMLADEHAHRKGLVASYPASSALHEGFATFCARTRMHLDEGLAAAERAVSLAPSRPFV